MKMRGHALASLLLPTTFILPGSGVAQDRAPHDLHARVRALADSAGIPGASFAILRGGEVVDFGSVGWRDTEGTPVVVGTVFEAASLSKPVFAYMVLYLVDEGVLSLDTPLCAYREDPVVCHSEPGRAITARMVLAHTSGLPNESPDASPLTPAFPPGSRFRYSGEGYQYLQRVVEAVTGQDLESLADSLVFGPAGMTHSTFVWTPETSDFAADGFRAGRVPAPRLKRSARAASSLHTTALDYARFMELLLRSPPTGGFSPIVPVDSLVSWSLGWALFQDGRRWLPFHWGDNSNTGFTAFAALSPMEGAGFVWLTNSTEGLAVISALTERLGVAGAGGARWIPYERHTSPQRRLRETLDAEILAHGAAGALRQLELLRATSPDLVDEPLLNSLGYRFLARGHYHTAVELFQRNTEMFPGSGNAHDSLGEALLAIGDAAGALRSYRKALSLDPENDNARRMIERLTGVRPD